MVEREPLKENEIVCGFCGPGTLALWEVVLTDGEQVFLCDNDYQGLLRAELILANRRIGDMTWENNLELREFLNEYERQKDTK
jgi:hypothetical protein